jgi:hypothetical protein
MMMTTRASKSRSTAASANLSAIFGLALASRGNWEFKDSCSRAGVRLKIHQAQLSQMDLFLRRPRTRQLAA